MFSLSGLDVHYLVREIRPLLLEAFVDKIYQSKDNKGQFLIRLRSPMHGKQQLFIKVPEALFLTHHRFEWPQQPSGFCMQLRKHLSNAQLVGIEQHCFDRIVKLLFRKGEIEWTLIIELFSKGNVVLVNSEGLIRGVMDLQRWKDRTLRVNAPYEYPPSVANTPELSQDEIEQLYDGRELVKFCASSLALGGKYSEALLAKMGVDKHITLVPENLAASLQEFLNQDISAVSNNDDASPFAIQDWLNPSGQSFSELIERLVVGEKLQALENDADTQVKSHENKYDKIINEQTNKLKGYEQAAEDNQRKGELIYERYQELLTLLNKVKAAHAKGGWTAVKELGLEVNEQQGSVVVDIPSN